MLAKIVHILIALPDPDMPEIKKNWKRYFINLYGIKSQTKPNGK